MKSLNQICMIGSCVTRDAWRIMGLDPSDIKFFTRTSFITLMSSPLDIPESAIELDSAFQRNAILCDANKSALKWISSQKPKTIIIDYIDDRYPILDVNGSYLLESAEFVNARVKEKLFMGSKTIPRLSQECTDLWVDSARLFFDFLEKVSPESTVVLHKAWFATVSRDGERFEEPQFGLFGKAREFNVMLRDYYSVSVSFAKDGIQVEAPSELLVANKGHLWGHAPVHYIDDYYRYVYKRFVDEVPLLIS